MLAAGIPELFCSFSEFLSLKTWIPTAKKPGILWGPQNSSFMPSFKAWRKLALLRLNLKFSCCSNAPDSCCNWFPMYKENGINLELWSGSSSSWSCSKTLVSEVFVCMRVKPFLRYYRTKTQNYKLDYIRRRMGKKTKRKKKREKSKEEENREGGRGGRRRFAFCYKVGRIPKPWNPAHFNPALKSFPCSLRSWSAWASAQFKTTPLGFWNAEGAPSL